MSRCVQTGYPCTTPPCTDCPLVSPIETTLGSLLFVVQCAVIPILMVVYLVPVVAVSFMGWLLFEVSE